MNSKIETYVGFAIKKGSAVFGVDAISRFHQKVYLILYTVSLAPNSQKQLQASAQKFACDLQQIPDYNILQMRNCKAIAICDKQLADAIRNSAFGGNNG